MPSDRPRFFKVEPLEKRLLLSATPMIDVPETESAPEVVDEVVVEEYSMESLAPFVSLAADPAILEITTSSASLTPDQTIENFGILVDSPVTIDSGETWLYRSTGSSIFFTQDALVNGSDIATQENLIIDSAQDVLVSAQIGVINPVHHLVVSAGQNVVFEKNIVLTGDLIVEAGASVVFQGSVRVGGSVQIGDSEDLSAIGSVQFQNNALLEVGGIVEIFTDGNVSFNANVGGSSQPQAITIDSNSTVSFNSEIRSDVLSVCALNISVTDRIQVDGNGITADPLQLIATNSLVLGGFSSLSIDDGGIILSANSMDLGGGPGSIASIGADSTLTLKPYDAGRLIGVAEASGNQFTRLDLSSADLAAIDGSFRSVVIGDALNGTGQIRIGAIGLTQSGSSAQILNPTTFVGGSVLVEGPIDVVASAEVLRLVARQGNVLVNGSINGTVAERSATVRLEAEGDIIVNQAIYATDLISLSAGFAGGIGSVIVNDTGLNAGALVTTSDLGPEGRIELTSGDTTGDIIFNGTGLDLLISVFGADGELVLRANGGEVTQTDGLIEAALLAVVAESNVTLQTQVNRVGNVVFGGEALRSGLGEAIDGIQITGATGTLILLESDDLILDRVRTGGGNVTITTAAGGGGDLRLGLLDAVEGDFTLQADGAIIDHLAGADAVNLTTLGAATLTARLGIGDAAVGDIDTSVRALTAVNAVSGGIYIQERGDLAIVDAGVMTQAGDGSIALTVGGGLVIEDAAPVRAHGSGHVLLDTESTLTVGDTEVVSTSGVLTILADGQIALQAGAFLGTATTGSILLRSQTAGLVMDATANVVATHADIRIETALSAIIGQLTADNLALVSGASVTATAGSLANITATNLRIEAVGSVGAASERLRTAVATLAVSANGTAENGIYVSQTGDLLVGAVAPVEIETFAADGSLSGLTDTNPLSDLVANTGGDIILVVSEGELALEDGADVDGISVHALGGGSVYLETTTAAESIVARASVLADTGALSVRSGGALTLEADVLFRSTGGAAIVLEALAGDLSMDGASSVVDGGGAVVLSASGDISLAALLADQAQIISQDGSIFNATGASLNILASSLLLSAKSSLGVAARNLTIEVDTLAAEVTGANSAGIFVAEQSSVSLEAATVAGDRFGQNGAHTGFSKTLTHVIATSGTIELSAQTDLEIDGAARVETLEAGAALQLTAIDGTLTMANGALVLSNNGDIDLTAELNAALSVVDAQGGAIHVVSAQGAILDNLFSETPNLITSGSASLEAATGIGAVGAADLNTDLGALSAQNSDSGLIVISEVDDLTVLGLSNLGSDGSIVVQSVGGSIILDGPTYAADGGNVLLKAGGVDSDLTVNDDITAASGAISLEATRHLHVNAVVEAVALGTLDFLTFEGDVTFSAVGRAISLNQNIRIEADGDAVLTGIDAGTADVSVIAASISDAGDTVRDIIASGLRVTASGSIGLSNALDLDVDTLAVRALSGSVNLSNLNDLRIGIVDTVPIDRVLLDSTSIVITDASKISDLLAANDITVVSENGSVEVRELSPDEVAFGGDSVGADQPSNVSAVNFAATPTVLDTVRQIGGFGVSLEPSAGYTGPAFTGGTQVVYFDTADYGVVDANVQNAQTGDFIRLEASKPGSFPDNVAAHLNAFVAFDTPRMIYSDIGSVSTETAGGMFADTEIRFMLETADGRFYLSEQTMNGNALAQTLTMPSIDGALWAEFSPDTDGDWRGNYDSLTFDQVLDPFEVVARMGVFSSRAVSATAIDVSSVLTVLSFDVGVRETLRQDIAIDSVDGVVTLTAADNIFQNASIRAVNGGQINLHAEGGLIRMDDGVLSSGSVAEIVYEANGNVELSTLQSGSGNISVVAGDRITDNRLTDDANLMTPALVTLSAVNGIGVFGASDILTDIGSLTATNTESGDIVIRERDGLVIAPDGVTTLVGDSSVIITAEEGDFTVNGDVSVSGAGRLLLNALGNSAAADLAVNARIETAAGSISLRAQDDLSFSNEGSATVAAGMGTLDLQAIDGLLTMAAASLVQTNGTNIRLLAQETVTLSIVDARSNVARLANTLDDQATWGDLTVRSVTGAILDARDRLDGSTAIYANAARFLAIGGIGQTGVGVDNPINLEATLLAASTTQGVINILEVTAIVVGSIDPLSVDRVDTDANVSSVGDANNLSGLTTSALVGGAVVMRTIDGTLVVENVVSTAGNGPILLQASGADSDILLNANVVSSSGPISIQAEDSITVDPSVLVQTGGAGTIDVFAVDGSVDMADTSRALASSGSLRIEAGGDILLSNAESLANVALIAGGSVLDNGDTRRDVLAAGLLIQAGVGVGTLGIGANPLEISVNTLTARAGSGGVNLRESNALSIGQLKVDVIRVAGDASTATETTGEQAGVRTTEDNGSVVIRLSEGNLSLAHTPLMTDQIALATHGEGNVLLETLGNFTNIGLSGGIETGGGHVTLVATSAVSLGAFAQIAVIGAGDVAIFSNFGGIAMNGTSRITSVTGHIRLSSSGDILVGGIETQGTVSLITLGASVLNNSSTQINVTADALRLQADVGIGTLVPFGAGDVVPLKTDVNTLSARSVVGNITLEEVDGLTVDDVGITVNRVEVNATTSTVSDVVQSDVRTQINNRSIVLRALAGDIVLNEGSTGSLGATLSDNTSVAVVGNGRVLIEAVIGDVIANANISSVAGDLSVIAGDTIRFASNANLITGNNAFSTGTLYIEAINGNVEQADGSQFIATLGDIRVAAGESIRLANVTTTAKVSLIAGAGSILDAGDADIDVSAAQLRLVAGTGIGLPSDYLDTDVDLLSARAGGGGVFIQGADDLVIGDTSATVQRYNPDNSRTEVIDATLSDVRTIEGDGSIVLRAQAGDLILNDGSAPADGISVSADGAGNIRLEADGVDADVLANADIVSATGHITLLATRDVKFIAGADLLSGGTGTVNVEAGSGLIEMNDQTKFSAGSGDMRLLANGDIRLGGLETTGNVSLTSETGSVLDNGDFYTNVVASGLRIDARIGIGSLDPLALNPIETRVATLSARATSGGINLLEETGLTVDDVAVTVQLVGADAEGISTTDATQSDVRTTAGNGSIILRTQAGNIILNDGSSPMDDSAVAAHGSGNILIEAIGAASGIEANADLLSDTGHISLVAHTDVILTDSADVVTSGSGTLFLDALNGRVEQADNSRLISENGDIRVRALDSIVLGGITTQAKVSLIAVEGSILDAGDSAGGEDVIAAGLRMEAGLGIGAPTDRIETRVNQLSARATAGGIFIEESDALVVAGVDASVERVQANAATSTETDALQSDVRTTAGNGSIVIRTLGGHLTLNDGANPTDSTAVSAHGSGHIRLEAAGANTDLLANADILSTSGHITLLAQRDIQLVANVEVATGLDGTIRLVTSGGSVEMADNSRLFSLSGDIQVQSEQNILVGGIATTGNVSLIAVTGSILDNGDTDTDVVANGLYVNAGLSVGQLGASTANPIETDVTTLTARAAAGGVNILEADTLIVGEVAVTAQSVGLDALLTPSVSSAQTGVYTVAGEGSIVLQTVVGDLILNDGSGAGAGAAVSAHGAGNIHLQALSAGSDLLINADVLATSGHINLLAARDVRSSAEADVLSGGTGTINVEAGSGSIAMNDQSKFGTGSGDLRLLANGDILLGGLETTGNVSLTATTGSVFDNGDFYTDVVANGLRIDAAVGIGSFNASTFNAVDTRISVLSARATSGGINLVEETGLTVDDVAVTVQRVGNDAESVSTTEATQSDVRTTAGNGSIVIRTLGGDLILNDGSNLADDASVSAHGSGHIRLEAAGAATDLWVNTGILSSSGHITLLAQRDLQLNAGASVSTGLDGTIRLLAIQGTVGMADGSLVSSLSGDIQIQSEDDILVGQIVTIGNVSLVAVTGSILDSGDALTNIVASGLSLNAALSVGQFGPGAANAIEIQVTTVTARATAGGINLSEVDELIVGAVEVVVQTVGIDAQLTPFITAAQTGIYTTAGDGSIVLQTAGGDLILNDDSGAGTAISAHGAGNVRLVTSSANTDILINADVRSTSGHITLLAARDVQSIAEADVLSGATGTINVEAGSGSIAMNDQSKFGTGSGDLRLLASSDIRLGGLETTGNVSLISEIGSVFDNGDFYTDVVASGLRIDARIGIGSLDPLAPNPIETRVATLSARATSGGINLLEETGLTVDDVAVTVQLVGPDAEGSPTTDATQSDVRTTAGNGSIILRTQAGDIILNDGSSPMDGSAVAAHGSGNILIEAIGAATGIEANANLLSGTGHISLVAHTDLTLNDSADVSTSGSGTLFLEALNGRVEQAENSRLIAENGDIRVWALDSILLGGITTEATVSLIAREGSILDQDDNSGGEDVIASGLRMEAGLGIGSPTDRIEIRVERLSAHVTSGGIFVEETDGLQIAGVDASVERVQANAASSTESDATQSDLRTFAGNGSIVIRTLAGDLSLHDGLNPAAAIAVSAHGSGHIRLEAAGAGTDLIVNRDILSGSGHITLVAQRDIRSTAGTDVSTGLAGTLRLTANAGSVEMASSSLLSSALGHIQIQGEQNILVGGIATAGNVSLIAVTGSILDNGDTFTNVVASGLSINAALSVGELGSGGANPIDTQVTTITARATVGGINILEADDLLVGSVQVTVQSVGLDAQLTPSIQSEQTGIYTTAGDGSIVLRTVAGDLTLNAGSGLGAGTALSANGAGNILVQTLGAGTDINLNSSLLSATGHVTMIAGGDVLLSSNSILTTSGNGSISIEASSGDFIQAESSVLSSLNGDIRIVASSDIEVRRITTDADVSLIATNGSISGSTTPGSTDIEASGLRLLAGANAGTAGANGHALETMVDSLSAMIATGDLRIENTGDLDLAAVSITVQKVDSAGITAVVTDAAFSRSINSSGSSILVAALEGGLTVQGGISSTGTAVVRLAASETLLINSAVTSVSADITIYSDADISVTAAGSVQAGGEGDIFIQSQADAFVMAAAARLTASGGNIRLQALTDLTLGAVSTGGSVSLISTEGAVLSAGSTARNVTAHALRIEAVGAGTSATPLQVRVDLLAAQVGANGLYLEDGSSILIGTVGLTTGQVLNDGTLQSVADAALNGATSLEGVIVLRALFDLTLSSVVTNQSAELTSSFGAILGAGSSSPHAQIGGTLTLSAESGIGRTGEGALLIDVDTLTLTNYSGSVYLSALSALELAGVDLVTSGDLYLNQTLGALQITAPISVANGRAVINAAEALLVAADITVGRDLRLVADSLTVSGFQIVASQGDIVIRTRAAALFDPTSGASAASGSIDITSGGTLTVSDFVAGVRIDLQANADILQSAGVLTAPAIRLLSETGNIGASNQDPIMTDTDRIDLTSDGDVFISEADGIQIGRAGISQSGSSVNDTVTLNLGDGTLSSATDSLEFRGEGTLVLNSSGELILGTLVRAENGSIAINADGLRDGTATEGLLIEALNGRVSIVTVAGVGGAGNADIEIAVNELTATTQTGDLELEVEGTTQVVADGLVIFNGAGNLNLNSIAGSLQVNAPIRHEGSGSFNIDLASGQLNLNSLITQVGAGNLSIHLANGGVSMSSLAQIQTGSGLLDLRASGLITLARISTQSGQINLESTSDSIRSLANFSGANIISLSRPTTNVAKAAQFTVDSSSVLVNGGVTFRGSNRVFIIISANFS